MFFFHIFLFERFAMMAVNLDPVLTIAAVVACGSYCDFVHNLWDESCDLLVALTVIVSVAYEKNFVTCASCWRLDCSYSCNCGNVFLRWLCLWCGDASKLFWSQIWSMMFHSARNFETNLACMLSLVLQALAL